MDIIRKKTAKHQDPYDSYEAYIQSQFSPTKEREKNNPEKIRKNEKPSQLKIIVRLAIFSLIAFFFVSSCYFVFKIGFVGKKISIDNENSSVMGNIESLISSFSNGERKPLRGEEEGRINILLLGSAGKGKPGPNLTDTIMMMSIDSKNKKIALFSFPRDLYVNIAETSYFTKINSVYQYGISNQSGAEPVKKTVEKISGIPIHYFLILDFEGFEKIIDDLGGINVSVEKDIYDPKYPGPNYSYELFEISKGLHQMDGKTALKYVRERHDDPEGDFGRAKRQQQVMQSIKSKAFSAKTFLNPIALNKLLEDLGENIKTDIKIEDLEGFIDLAKKSDTQNITNVVIDAWKKDSVLKVSHVFSGGIRAFVLVPRFGNYSEIQDLSKNIFDLDSLRRRKAEIEKEASRIIIYNKSDYPLLGEKVKDILENKIPISNIKLERYHNIQKTEKETRIYDKTNGEKIFTLDEIIKKLGIKLGKDAIMESGDADLILILGNDLENIENFEEGDIQEFENMPDSQNYFELIGK